LAAFISQTSCSGPDQKVMSTGNAGLTVPGADNYVALQGTSMATPHVSGVIALILSLQPKLTADEVKSVLQSTARPHPVGTWCATMGIGQCGSGLLDANAALNHVVNNRPVVTVTGPTAPLRPLAQFSLFANVQVMGGRTFMPGSSPWVQTSGPTATFQNLLIPTPYGRAPTSSGVLGFTYTAIDSAGYASSASLSVMVNSPPVLNTLPTSTLTAGAPATGKVTATDADGDSVTYAMTASPPGMTMNSATGDWTWTPSAAGSFSMTVIPADAAGQGSPVTYSFTVNAPTPPASSSAVAPSGGGGGAAGVLTIGLLLAALLTASLVRNQRAIEQSRRAYVRARRR
jgi:serine protease